MIPGTTQAEYQAKVDSYTRPSKHRAPFCGAVRLGVDSGIRKLARAMRRGTVPAERMQMMLVAGGIAESRRNCYVHATKRRQTIFESDKEYLRAAA